jgi:8-oxo-dGTP pyrophosphatase MutT (NUDIX family)
MTRYMHAPSAGGIVIHKGKLLVIASARRNSVDLPKGTIEEGESIEEAALREVEEETGYRVRIERDLGSLTFDYQGQADKNYRKTVSYFLMSLADFDSPIKNLQEGEDFENKWLTPSEALEQLTYDDTRAMVARVIEGL